MSLFEVDAPTQSDFELVLRPALDATALVTKLVATEAHGNVRKGAPVDQGRLAGSWRLDRVNDLMWRGVTDVNYARMVSEGTRAHEIRPKSARALAFRTSGGMVFATVVHHPGTKANPYVEDGLKRAYSRLDEFMSQALRGGGA